VPPVAPLRLWQDGTTVKGLTLTLRFLGAPGMAAQSTSAQGMAAQGMAAQGMAAQGMAAL
jgi:hypothetical protein